MRIAIAAFHHETNTFAIEQNDAIEHARIEKGAEMLEGAHPKSFIGGFAEAAGQPGVELVPTRRRLLRPARCNGRRGPLHRRGG